MINLHFTFGDIIILFNQLTLILLNLFDLDLSYLFLDISLDSGYAYIVSLFSFWGLLINMNSAIGGEMLRAFMFGYF